MSILQNAAEVLRCFDADCPDLTVSEVVRRLSMPKANASRLFKSMRAAGLLETVGDTHRHRPGILLINMASLLRHSSDLLMRSSAVMAQVSATFGHTAYISLREGREVTAVADFEGSNALRVVSNIGRRLPAHLSATGRTLLARMPDAKVLDLYDGHPAAATLPERLAAVRRDGYALSSQETTPGVDAIAIALSDPATSETISLCIVYPHGHVADDARSGMIEVLAEAAAAIATDMGDTAFVLPSIIKRKIR